LNTSQLKAPSRKIALFIAISIPSTYCGKATTGIIDWVNACIGPAGVDVGHCRLNLALLHGVEMADQFLKSYIQVSDATFIYDPYWDLKVVFEFLPSPPSTVLQSWIAHGVMNLTDRKIRERFEEYMLSLDRQI
jgi:hypothetical protein